MICLPGVAKGYLACSLKKVIIFSINGVFPAVRHKFNASAQAFERRGLFL